MPSGIYQRRTYELPPRSKSGMKGVIYQRHDPRLKKPWKAYCRQHGMYVCLGYYATKEEAAAVYNRKARQLFGPTAFRNPL